MAFLVLGCDKPAAPTPAASAPGPSASVARPLPSASAAAPASTTAGTWGGTYEAQHYLIEARKNEGAREWAADDGGANTGTGQLTLNVAEGGDIRGVAKGPLGEQVLVGEVDAEVFRVRFTAKTPGDRAFSGFTVLTREGDQMKGRLQASTGDSKTVRDALIVVSRGGAKPAVGEPVPNAAPSGS